MMKKLLKIPASILFASALWACFDFNSCLNTLESFFPAFESVQGWPGLVVIVALIWVPSTLGCILWVVADGGETISNSREPEN